MYLVALVVLIVVLLFTAAFGQTPSAVLNILDIPSLFLIALITPPMLLASGLAKDLKRAFAVVMAKNSHYTKLELERSLEAVRLTIKLILYSGIFTFLIGAINIFKHVHAESLGPNMSVNLISIVYALFGCFILLPIQSKLKVLILSCTKEP